VAVRDLKNGRWIKLWATVFAFHHNPIATTGIENSATRIAPCTIDSDTRTHCPSTTPGVL
jgi:hypothetical protein